jgi:hypothetical protein
MADNSEKFDGPAETADVEGSEGYSQPWKPAEAGKEACTWAMVCHLAGLSWLLWWIMPLVGGVVGALIVWQIKKGADPFIDVHGKEALNFQISMLIYGLIAGLLLFACIGIVLLPAVMVADVVFSLVAAVKASKGQAYKYPMTIRFVK